MENMFLDENDCEILFGLHYNRKLGLFDYQIEFAFKLWKMKETNRIFDEIIGDV